MNSLIKTRAYFSIEQTHLSQDCKYTHSAILPLELLLIQLICCRRWENIDCWAWHVQWTIMKTALRIFYPWRSLSNPFIYTAPMQKLPVKLINFFHDHIIFADTVSVFKCLISEVTVSLLANKMSPYFSNWGRFSCFLCKKESCQWLMLADLDFGIPPSPVVL